MIGQGEGRTSPEMCFPPGHTKKHEGTNFHVSMVYLQGACAFGARLCASLRARTDIRSVSEEGMQTPPADVVLDETYKNMKKGQGINRNP